MIPAPVNATWTGGSRRCVSPFIQLRFSRADPDGPGSALTVDDEGFNYRSLRANSVFR